MTRLISGYAGNIAFVDLSLKKVWTEETPWNAVKHVIGGKGLGAWFLYKLLPPKIHPLDSKNVFILATGPAQGMMPIAGRYVIVTRSPHTGLFLDSHVGGFLGPELKYAGFDALVVKGASRSPVWLEVSNNQIVIQDAADLWGLTTHETEETLHSRHDLKSKVLSIGQAGENLVSIACTTSDLFRNAGRGGIGALLGTKKLKAISVRGSLDIPLANEGPIRELKRDITIRARANRKHSFYRLGTSGAVEIANELDMLPVQNYQRGETEGAVDGYLIEERYGVRLKKRPCHRCPIACSLVIDSPYEWASGYIQHPEYESLGLLGSNLGINDMETLLHLNHLCQLYGMDTISTGGVIAWFMECAQRDAVPRKFQTEQIQFGDGKGALDLIRKISLRQGVGGILAEGVQRAAAVFGGGSDKWAVHVKGLEMPAWDPRGRLGLGISYAVSPLGGSHLQGWPSTRKVPEESAVSVMESLVENQDLKILYDSLIMCAFVDYIKPTFEIADMVKMMEGFTGETMTTKDLRSKAHQIWLLTRIINEREYEKSPIEYDVLPYRHMKDPLPTGRAINRTAFVNEKDFVESRAKLYELRDLNELGAVKPTVREPMLSKLALN
ncbi:MAG: aldehyde ferredoxin oxidoreductase family protein [Candidatus Thorarchaeota archaeon]